MNKAIIEFLDYTNNYLDYGNMIDLKIKHTFRVMRLSEMLANNLDLDEEEIYIAKMIGLLHDIGRFEQWKVYNTFRDLISIDHADYGVSVLKKNNYIRKYVEEDKYDKLILKSIKYHNKYKLPKNLTKQEKKFIEIIRDADKIDILFLYTIRELDVELDEELSEYVYQTLLERNDVDRKKLKTKTDLLAVSLGFIFDINLKESVKYLKDKKYCDTIIDIYKKKTNNKKLKNQLEEIRKIINNYIEERLSC